MTKCTPLNAGMLEMMDRLMESRCVDSCGESGDGSPEESMQASAQDSGYNSSGSSAHQSASEMLNGGAEDDEMIHTRSRVTSHASISTVPACALTSLSEAMRPDNIHDAHDCFPTWDSHSPLIVPKIRQRESTFRKPSSLRAMQLDTEDEGDDEYLNPPKRRASQLTSGISIRSAGSSLKRSPFYAPTGGLTKVKKEGPLVLLHCTLLAPSLPVPGLVGHPNHQKLLKEVLPPVYWKRWKLLEQKTGSGLVRERGVLISHPEDMYDLLEERLLESLELQRPRLDNGHFIGGHETDSDGEDGLEMEGSSSDDEGEECPDCRSRAVRHNMHRKWEIKVFAANGLMKAGAWAAAWKEMEKVDVEVGLWLPPDLRAELESRLVDDASLVDKSLPAPLPQEPEDFALGNGVRARRPSVSRADLAPRVTQDRERSSPSPVGTKTSFQGNQRPSQHAPKSSEEIDLQTLLINYIRVLASDRRNVAIVFLCGLLLFLGINSRSVSSVSGLGPFPADAYRRTKSTMVPLQQHATRTWNEDTGSETLPATLSDTLMETTLPETLTSKIHASVRDFMAESEEPPAVIEPSTAESAREVATTSTNTPSTGNAQITAKEPPLPATGTVFDETAQNTSTELAETLSAKDNKDVPEELSLPATKTENSPIKSTQSISEKQKKQQTLDDTSALIAETKSTTIYENIQGSFSELPRLCHLTI
ncbi:hypothetical protein BJX61DRAFT_449637 [Aspergillus egyptiacus]|nr:hypothetical protein BJX61DRAFT_449637 [Aspergillus egyptiacus]